MQAGRLDQRVTIKQKVAVQDTFGGETVTWSDVCSVWAQVSPISGREYLQGKQLQEEQMVRIRIRHRAGVVPAMRVHLGSRTFDIIDVQNIDTANKETVLMCRELL
jgi:SPP1 family predicted phage head-tail adaptor